MFCFVLMQTFMSRLLVIGGNSYSGYSTDDEITADMFGITKWRILSDNPYYKKDRSESTTSKVPVIYLLQLSLINYVLLFLFFYSSRL